MTQYTIITDGYGSYGSINSVILDGYSSSEYVSQDPYEIYGDVESPGSGVTVTVTNLTTSEYDTYTTDSGGMYSVDISIYNPEFPSGWTDGDTIEVSADGYTTNSGLVDEALPGTEIDIVLAFIQQIIMIM